MKIWEKVLRLFGHDCNGNWEIGSKLIVPLRGGAHTKFYRLVCAICGNVSAFPSDNLDIAEREATEEGNDFLKQQGYSLGGK